MSRRLQVLLDESEMHELRRLARRSDTTVSERVRKALRAARRSEPTGDADRKLVAVRAASQHAFPTADIEQMLAEIGRGHGAPPKA